MSDIKKRKIGFIGYGNMAGATARGLILSGAVEPEQIYVCAKDFYRRQALYGKGRHVPSEKNLKRQTGHFPRRKHILQGAFGNYA